MRIAFVKDFLPLMRGAEKVLEALCEIYPDADIYALFHNKGALSPTIERHKISTSFIQNLPLVQTHYRYYLPFFPTAIERFDLREYDVILSQSQCVAKGAIKSPNTLHICYCLTPMRYIWDMYDVYFPKDEMGLLKRAIVPPIANYLRRWDIATLERVDKFVAISTCVAERIKKWYCRQSDVIFPPADDVFYTPSGAKREDFYLLAGAFAPYKRTDLAINAFIKLGKRLVVIGSGQDERKIQALASGHSNIELLGWQPNDVLRDYYRRARALIFPGEEDFGIVPVEAQLCGMPIIAYGRGGALDTVVDGRTGVFFNEQTVEGVCDVVNRFEQMKFSSEIIRANVLRLGKQKFKDAMKQYIEREYELFRSKK